MAQIRLFPGLLLIPMFLSLLPSSMLEWDLLSSRKPSSTDTADRSTVGRELQLLGVSAVGSKSAEEPLLLTPATPGDV